MSAPGPRTAEELETPAGCPLCGAALPRPTPYGEDPFRVVRCGACHLYFLSPRLSESAMADHYRSGDYFGGLEAGGGAGYADYASQETSLRLTFRRLLQTLSQRGVCGGALLEVGCGYGYFLDEARALFDERVGTELSAPAARQARRRADRIVTGGVQDLGDEERFDCVVALQVIEHVYEPLPFVRDLLGRLRPGGALLLSTPDMGSAWRRGMGRRWPSFKIPEHVVFYDARSLPGLMARAGLEGLARVPHPHAFPVSEVWAKLGLGRLGVGTGRSLWIPGTTIAWLGHAAGPGAGAGR